MEDFRPSPEDAQRVVRGSKRARANATNMNRLQSWNEIARTHARSGAKKSRNAPSVSPFLGNDLMHVAHGQSNTKTCGICRQQGHQRNNCERVTHWKFPPLVRSGELATRQRKDLASKLHWIPPADCAEVENGCPISDSVPYRVKGVVIHKQMSSATLRFVSCFECTLLDKNILPESSFTKCFLQVVLWRPTLHEAVSTLLFAKPKLVGLRFPCPSHFHNQCCHKMQMRRKME